MAYDYDHKVATNGHGKRRRVDVAASCLLTRTFEQSFAQEQWVEREH